MRCTSSGANRAAMGSMLLRSPGSSKPVQYDSSGTARSRCPAARARLSRYAAKRCCCAPGAEEEALMCPDYQLKMESRFINSGLCLFYDTVVLRACNKTYFIEALKIGADVEPQE